MAPSSQQRKDAVMADSGVAASLRVKNDGSAVRKKNGGRRRRRKKKKVMMNKKKMMKMTKKVNDVGSVIWGNLPQQSCQLLDDIVGLLRACQVLIVVADSQSHKSMPLPRRLGRAWFAAGRRRNRIACVYFSSEAAITAAGRPLPRLRTDEVVGLTVRGHPRSGPAALDFMSVDRLLLEMAAGDKDLSSYSMVIVDSAHHRTVSTDLLLGSLLPLLVRRGRTPGDALRLVLQVAPSAAHEAEKLSAFFSRHCCTRTCVRPENKPPRPPPPVISYIPFPGDGVQEDPFEAALSAAIELHRREETCGGILLFLGGGSVEEACRWVRQRIAGSSNPKDKRLHAIPLYTGDNWELRLNFPNQPSGRCLYILSPEVPDASPRLPSRVSYVIDPGVGKHGGRISQQSANDRAAHLHSANPRLGGPKCLRLYEERVYRDQMPPTTIPKILTCPAQALLKMKWLEVTDPRVFDFIDPPPIESMAPQLPDLSRLSLG